MSAKRRVLTGTSMVALGVLAGAAQAAEIQWNAAVGDWFAPANWTSGTVPVGGDDASVNNGGTAIADSASPLYPGGNATAATLSVGASITAAGPVSGTVIGNGVGFNLAGTSVGVAGGATTTATGSITTTGAGLAAGTLTVGVANSSAANASALGTVSIDGALTANTINIGTATGTGAIGQGSVSAVGGSGTSFIGIGAAQGAGNQATGLLQVTGASSFNTQSINLGSASDGATAQGRMLLDPTSGNITSPGGFLSVGTSFGTGPSSGQGELSAHAYTLSNGSVFVGASDGAGNSATGTMALSQLNWSGVAPMTFSIGVASNGASASGQVSAATGGIAGSVATFVGVSAGDGSQASGQLNTGALTFGSTSSLTVGSAAGGSATGVADIAGISGLGGLSVGAASHFLTTEATASGQLTVGSGGVNAPAARMFVGTASSSAPSGDHAATGLMTVTGGNVAAAALTVGSTSGASSANGSYIQTGGTFSLQSPQGLDNLSIGSSGGGHATGAFELTGVSAQVGGGLIVGTDFDFGAAGTHSATGVVTLRNSAMTAGFAAVGFEGTLGAGSFGNGTLNLTNSTLEVTAPTLERPFNGFVNIGISNGRGVARLEDSVLKAAEGVTVGNSILVPDVPTSELILIRSKVESLGIVLLGDTALLEIGIEGALRGSEYGAIDALAGVALDGDLKLVFDFLPSLSLYVFDLIIGAEIFGDFDSVALIDLPTGYVVSHGIVQGEAGDIYRVTLAQQVPEPATLALFLLGLAGLAAMRSRP